ncbi:PaaX family transcriptional regulator C-terminal domain-containing protein [Propionibacteriaceae bacterium Y2011]|uniref:PaaX family transcriptional regulator C-terminal domain-containing protein n=1 Tax=Microlunatus sp. Y2014 TaxID=3418488 RepID=UPI003B4480A8
MPAQPRTEAIAKVPFLFGAARAVALPGPVLVRLMTELGGTQAAAKGLLHRLVRYGQLSLTRHGRVGVYRMAGDMLRGFEALRGEMTVPPEPAGWDGRFHMLVYDIPEVRRDFRDMFRGAAQRNGYRQLRAGVLVSPYDHTGDPSDLSEVISRIRDTDGMVLEAGWWEPENAADVFDRAWQLAEVADRFRRVAAGMRRTAAEAHRLSGEDALVALHEASGEAYLAMLSDRPVPDDVLPADWPRPELMAALAELNQRLWPVAARHVAEVIAESGHADLVEADPAWPA